MLELFQLKKVINVFLILGMVLGINSFSITEDIASAAPVIILTGETFTPTMSPPARLIGPEFNRGLENATGGMVKTKWHTASALGPTADLYTRIVTRVIDYGQFNIGYTPGVFPISEMFELPIRFPSGEILTKAMIEIYKKGYLEKDYADVKFLFFYNIGPYQLWSNVKITSVEGLVGKKIRCPSPTFVEMTKALGAIPVSMVGGEIYSAMEKKIIDGTWACGDMAAAFKLGEVAKYVVMTNIGTITHTWAMNKIAYQSLPETGKKYIEENWEKFSLLGGRYFDEYNEKGFVFAREKKVETVVWSEMELKKMDNMIVPVFKSWLNKVESKGLPGKKALSDFHQILSQLGGKEPFLLQK